ncbi:unnamed protein product [Vitrella brassicaformis CCMP3155]|uniref:Uncharacterized protein n=1 Tax=Vitrella brassicaformis (strain CCMP3155) TaxID=1169540 RepID=A0A0G4GYF2_VITBC|nr:unnamed protein product [Vitrella brassicaformis CCMP3155]|eukprot:CEM36013.1 unnamed protein product [Vitrella brassicaformis CCMP3155]
MDTTTVQEQQALDESDLPGAPSTPRIERLFFDFSSTGYCSNRPRLPPPSPKPSPPTSPIAIAIVGLMRSYDRFGYDGRITQVDFLRHAIAAIASCFVLPGEWYPSGSPATQFHRITYTIWKRDEGRVVEHLLRTHADLTCSGIQVPRNNWTYKEFITAAVAAFPQLKRFLPKPPPPPPPSWFPAVPPPPTHTTHTPCPSRSSVAHPTRLFPPAGGAQEARYILEHQQQQQRQRHPPPSSSVAAPAAYETPTSPSPPPTPQSQLQSHIGQAGSGNHAGAKTRQLWVAKGSVPAGPPVGPAAAGSSGSGARLVNGAVTLLKRPPKEWPGAAV